MGIKQEGCIFCENPLVGRTPIEEGDLDLAIMRVPLQIHWVLLPPLPGMSSVTPPGKHLIFTTTSHHVGNESILDERVREQLLVVAHQICVKYLGKNFRLMLNEGLAASSFTHFHAHCVAPGPGERLPSLVKNIPAELDKAAEEGLISAEAAEVLKNRLLQKPKS